MTPARLRVLALAGVAVALGGFTARLARTEDALALSGPFLAAQIWLGAALVVAIRYARAPGALVATVGLWAGGAVLLLAPGVGLRPLAWALALLALGLSVARLVARRFIVRRQLTWLVPAAWLPAGALWLGTEALPALSIPLPLAAVVAIGKVRLVEAEARVLMLCLDALLFGLLVLEISWLRLEDGLHLTLLVCSTAALLGLHEVGRRAVWSRDPLARLPDAVHDAADLEAALETLCAAVRDALGLTSARYLLHEGDGRLRVFGEPAEGTVRLRAQGRLLAYTATFGAPVFVEDLRAEPLAEAEEALLTRPAGGTALLVPCLAGGALAGLLQLGPRADGHPIRSRSYRSLATLAARLGDIVDPLWWVDRLGARLAAEQAQVTAAGAATLATAGRDVARRLRPLAGELRARAEGDAELAALLPSLEAVLGDAVAADEPGAPVALPLADWLEDTVDLVRADAEAAQVTLVVAADEQTLRADPARLGLALRLLCDSAIEALAVWSGPRHLTVSARREGGSLLLGVADTGPARSVDPGHPWSGADALRLAVADRVARQHGGRLRTSAGPRGVELTLELPAG